MIYNVLFSKSYEKNLKYEELYNQISLIICNNVTGFFMFLQVFG